MKNKRISYKNKYYMYTFLTQFKLIRIVNILFILKYLNFSLLQFSFLESIFLFSQFILEIPSGIVGDRFNKKYTILLGIVLLIMNPILIISAINFFPAIKWMLLIIAFSIEGIGNALLSGSDDALFYEEIKKENSNNSYAKIRGKMQLIIAISLGISTFIGGYMYSINIYFTYIIQSILLMLSFMLIINT